MRIGLSDSFGAVEYNLGRNQQNLANSVKQLSSGLRINSAADDPSGLAIAESLRSISNGLQQGTTNVQTASNALTVAESALHSVTALIQRMRALTVEARSDLNSAQNIADLQTEIDQLSQEINRIASNANFNGLHLLDGSLSNTQQQAPYFIFEQNPTVGGTTQTLISTDPTLTYVSNTPVEQQAQMSFSIDSYDATTNELQVTLTVSSPDPSFGPAQQNVFHVTPGTNYFVEFGGPPPPPGNYQVQNAAGQYVFAFGWTAPLSVNDVGKTAYVVTEPTQYASGGQPLTVNTGAGEGSTVAVSIDAANTAALGINEIVLGDDLMNYAAQTRLDNALNLVTGQEASIGAQQVALGEQANDASIQIVNQVASESSIRDLNIASATTEFTKEQILVSVGTSVLSQMEVSTQQLTTLLIGAISAAHP
ncbi:MAG: flagellin [bacterium]|nr:flagellin [bacterium]